MILLIKSANSSDPNEKVILESNLGPLSCKFSLIINAQPNILTACGQPGNNQIVLHNEYFIAGGHLCACAAPPLWIVMYTAACFKTLYGIHVEFTDPELCTRIRIYL